MSEFILIVPAGWTQIDLVAATLIPGFSIPAIKSWIETQNWLVMVQELASGGLLKETDIILEAQIFNDETFLVKLG